MKLLKYKSTAILLCLLLNTLWSFKTYATPTSTTPSPRLTEYEWMTTATWYRHHADDIEAAKKDDTELVFIGDSITESWGWNEKYQAVFQKIFGQYKSVNLAIGGDMTQNLLWRLDHGAAGSLNPKVVVLMIGVNNLNLGKHTPEQTALGVGTVIERLQTAFPNAHIINHAILPYEEKANHPNRIRAKTTNAILKQFAEGSAKVHYVNFGKHLLNKKGNISKAIMDDFLHPTPKGMAILGAKLKPHVDKLLRADKNE